jgi:hypothetical protein
VNSVTTISNANVVINGSSLGKVLAGVDIRIIAGGVIVPFKCKRCKKVWKIDLTSHKVKGCIACLHIMENPTYEKLFGVKLIPYSSTRI